MEETKKTRQELVKQMWQDCEAFLKEMSEKYKYIIIKDSAILEKNEYVYTWIDEMNREKGFNVSDYPISQFNIRFEVAEK